jgi:hypothetical protein
MNVDLVPLETLRVSDELGKETRDVCLASR